jgi:hypothetical protein
VAICTARKRDGSPCTLPVKGQQKVCWAHDPANSEKRRRTASKGGRSRPNRELADLKAKVEKLAEDVLEGKVEKGRAAVCNQIYNSLLRLLELERKIKEQEDILQRIEALERRLDFGSRRGGKW